MQTAVICLLTTLDPSSSQVLIEKVYLKVNSETDSFVKFEASSAIPLGGAREGFSTRQDLMNGRGSITTVAEYSTRGPTMVAFCYEDHERATLIKIAGILSKLHPRSVQAISQLGRGALNYPRSIPLAISRESGIV